MEHLGSRYTRALETEAGLAAAEPEWSRASRITSIFFGGGTPTTLPATDLARVLDTLKRRFDVDPEAEVTIEANPDTVDADKLRALREAGFTRVSMGAQSFDPNVLLALERVHQPESVSRGVGAAREAGIGNMNLDLIFGADGETLASWENTLRQTIELAPEHVSAYALTIEPATPLGRRVADGNVPAPDPDLQADMFALACEKLGAAGYEHYEVSNWTKPGKECLHNLTYWRRHAYLGLGAGAHSFLGDRRSWNVRPPEQYLEMVERGERPQGGEEHLTPEDASLEDLFLHLRTREGIGPERVAESSARPFLEEGLLARGADGNYVLTERGMFLANELVLALSG
jgi:oxygen-independent coproporphyrinogen-3 oxidase